MPVNLSDHSCPQQDHHDIRSGLCSFSYYVILPSIPGVLILPKFPSYLLVDNIFKCISFLIYPKANNVIITFLKSICNIFFFNNCTFVFQSVHSILIFPPERMPVAISCFSACPGRVYIKQHKFYIELGQIT